MSEALKRCKVFAADKERQIAALQKEILSFRREVLAGLLNQCTQEQQTIFYRMYPSVADIPVKKIDWAIQQCENTIKFNESEQDE